MPAPPGYSVATMRDLVRRYSDIAADLNTRSAPGALDDVNVGRRAQRILRGPHRSSRDINLTADPIPFTHRVMERTPSGDDARPEVRWWRPRTWSSRSSPACRCPQFAPAAGHRLPDARSRLLQLSLGRRALRTPGARRDAPFTPSRHRCTDAPASTPSSRFDEFISQGDAAVAGGQDRAGSPLISDASAFDEVDYQIERANNAPCSSTSSRCRTTTPCVDIYDDPVPTSGLTGDSPEERLEGYLRWAARTPTTRSASSCDGLRGSDEKTAVVFYGDHQPPLAGPPGFVSSTGPSGSVRPRTSCGPTFPCVRPPGRG